MNSTGSGGKSILTRLGIQLAALVALAACAGSGDSGNGTEEGESPTNPAVSVNTRYDSVYDLREKVESVGYGCTEWSIVADPAEAEERASCTDVVVLSIHTNAAQVQRSVDGVAELTLEVLDSDSIHLVGPNWSVNCGEDLPLCEGFRQVLGGEIDHRQP
jgi:hypothetical protein